MYHLYSHNDLDGVGCGIIAKCAFGADVEVRYNSVDGLNFQVERFLERAKMPDDFLFITDLSVNEQNETSLNEFVNSGGKMMLIDHHKTALHFNKYKWGRVKVEYNNGRLACATSLLYDYLIQNQFLSSNKTMDQFVELVRQYDTWEWERNGSTEPKRLNDLFFLYSIDEFEEKMLGRIIQDHQTIFDEFEEKLLDKEEEKKGRYVARKKREIVQTFIHDLCVGIVNAESYHSELGNELGKEHTHLDYIAILNMGGKKVSFRTIHDEIDVSEIAGRYGGGGHAKAAGCSMNQEVYLSYVAEPFPLEPLRVDASRNMYNLKGNRCGVLFENRNQELFYIFFTEKGWQVIRNGILLDYSFISFEEVEREIKRSYSAWLARDERYVAFLTENIRKTIFQH